MMGPGPFACKSVVSSLRSTPGRFSYEQAAASTF